MSQKGKEFKVSVLLFDDVKPVVYLQAKITVGKRGSENMKISGWDCDFDSCSKFSILLTA